jgi:HPt (histidine-containing phosphotransfer) domain-containing protein
MAGAFKFQPHNPKAVQASDINNSSRAFDARHSDARGLHCIHRSFVISANMASEMSGDGFSDDASQRPLPLDAAALARLRELDPDGRHGVLHRVLTVFDTSLSRMLVQLAAEQEAGDPGVVAAIAHTLKSSSASVGALELSRACGLVERRLRDGASGDLDADVGSLLRHGHAALLSVRAMLRA